MFLMILNCFVPELNLPFFPYLPPNNPPKLVLLHAFHKTMPSTEWKFVGGTGIVRPEDKPAPHDPGFTESLFYYNFVILFYLKDGEGAMT